MMSIRRCLLTAATLALALPIGAVAQEPVGITGVWILNEAESDTIALPAADSGDSRRGFRVRVGSWPTGVPYRSIADPGRMRRAIEAVRDAPDRIFLVRDDTTAILSFDAEPPITLWTDGREVERLWVDGASVEVRAEWRGRALRVVREIEDDIEITQTYEPVGRRLVVHTVVEGPIPRKIELRRVYERAPEG